MKKLFHLILLLNIFIIIGFKHNFAFAQVDPWPWAITLPFPWENIEGTWSEKTSEFTFSFQVIQNSWGNKHIRVKQYNNQSGKLVAQGVGWENSESIVVAGMSGGETQEYWLTIRSIQSVFCWDHRKVTGVTIESPDHQLIEYFEIFKIGELPLTPFNLKEYNRAHFDTLNYSVIPSCLNKNGGG